MQGIYRLLLALSSADFCLFVVSVAAYLIQSLIRITWCVFYCGATNLQGSNSVTISFIAQEKYPLGVRQVVQVLKAAVPTVLPRQVFLQS